jgi:hypothetical protein
MVVLIVKQNQDFFTSILGDIEFTDRTKNTCTFEIKPKAFNELYDKVKELGHNPYSLMSW